MRGHPGGAVLAGLAAGLAVPGMPAGSPGMQVEGMEPDTAVVVLFGPGGCGTFARDRGAKSI